MFEIPEMRRIKKIHFIGVGGAGMSGIAEVLHNQGYEVSGSDLYATQVTARLQDLGVAFYQGHAPEQVEGKDVVVISTAIGVDNPELSHAQALRIPVVKRAEMLGELMRFRHGISVAGTHGKTTTTSLLTTILKQAALDPTYVIGGLLNSAGASAKLGSSHYLVAEADESDASFMHLQSMVTIVTNIDEDHMDTYGGDVNRLRHVFLDFIHQLPFYGLAVVCLDDPGVQAILPEINRPLVTYGFSENADVRAVNLCSDGLKTCFDVEASYWDEPLCVCLNMPGSHNVLNALAAISVAAEEGIDVCAIQAALSGFQGVGRRFQTRDFQPYPEFNLQVVDDYGHHPSEVLATIEAARVAWPGRRLVMLFQPHRYSRTRDCFDRFIEVLSKLDVLILLDVYPAGESAIAHADSKSLCKSIRARGTIDPIYLANQSELEPMLRQQLKTDDVFLMQGAGNIGAIAQRLVQQAFDFLIGE